MAQRCIVLLPAGFFLRRFGPSMRQMRNVVQFFNSYFTYSNSKCLYLQDCETKLLYDVVQNYREFIFSSLTALMVNLLFFSHYQN
jgi:hypothetical protein